MSIWPSLVTIGALLLYLVVTINVGRARIKYKIMPPEMTGDENFERVVRVQQNTLEQLVLFLPGLWLFSEWINPIWAGGLGGVWIVGRILFAWGYYQAAEKRTLGFAISSLVSFTLLGGAIVGVILSLISAPK
ncbi:MAG TPA: MAPEG family protein [Candidatus Obscuribacterales bacterium]